MGKRTRVVRRIGLSLVLLTLLSAGAAAQSDVDVTPGEKSFDGELWVRAGDGSAAPVGGADECPGCVWRLVPACAGNSAPIVGPDGSVRPVDDDLCAGAVNGCSDGEVRYRAYRRRPGESFHLIATLCLGLVGEPVSGAALRAEVARYFTSMPLPLPGLHMAPPGPSVVGIATLFHADAGGVRSEVFGPFGLQVRITAAPGAWEWEPEPGVGFTTDWPGAPYPSRAISHTYRHAAGYPARVTATWTATYSVLGSGLELPVSGTVRRTSTAVVDVHEARPELIEGPPSH